MPSMRVLVTGGTGTLGRRTVAALLARGHLVTVTTSRATSVAPDGAALVRADVRDRDALREAVQGADAVVHLASSPGRQARSVDVGGTSTLLGVLRDHEVKHLVHVSIVGCDRAPLGYYRAKLAAEELVRRAGQPFTVVRATQFHPFAAELLRRLPVTPKGWLLQPIDVDDVAAALAERLDAGAASALVEVAGPEVLPVAELARILRETGRRGPRPTVRLPGRLSHAVADGALTAPLAARPGRTFAEWAAGGR